MQYTNDELYDLFKKLPPDVREAYGSVEYMKVLDEIEKKHGLHIDQAGELSNEIYKLVLGITLPQKFISAVASSVRVTPETAREITEEVNQRIFRPVKDSLVQIHKMKESAEKPEDELSLKEEVGIDEIPEAPSREENKTGMNFSEEKLTGNFSMPKKTGGSPDPYREPTV